MRRLNLESHGGYLLRLETFRGVELVPLCREALALDGVADECGLLVSVSPRRKVVRLAFDGPFVYGRKGAQWYASHHALARLLSRALPLTVHAYVYDVEEGESVVTYGNGRKVGGERLLYEDVDVPETEEGELEQKVFEQLKTRWPLGHLAYVFGLKREELLRLPRSSSVLLALDGSAQPEALSTLL